MLARKKVALPLALAAAGDGTAAHAAGRAFEEGQHTASSAHRLLLQHLMHSLALVLHLEGLHPTRLLLWECQ